MWWAWLLLSIVLPLLPLQTLTDEHQALMLEYNTTEAQLKKKKEEFDDMVLFAPPWPLLEREREREGGGVDCRLQCLLGVAGAKL